MGRNSGGGSRRTGSSSSGSSTTFPESAFGLLPGLFLRLGVVPPGVGDALLGGGALLEQGKIVGF